MSQRLSVFTPHFEHQDVKCRTNGKSPMSFSYLCKVALMRRLTKEYTFPKSSFPGEPQPSPPESTFQQCFSSCSYGRMLCRLGMWTAHLSMLCACIATFTAPRPCQEGSIISPKFWNEAFGCLLEVRTDSRPSGLFCGGFFFFLIQILSFLCVSERPCKTSWWKHKLRVRKHCMSGGSLGK